MSNFYNDLQSWSENVISFGTNQNNILIVSSVVFLEPSVDNLEITGFNPERLTISTMLWLRNRSTTNSIILKHENTGSTSDYRINTSDGLDYTIAPKTQVFLLYDQNRWWVF